MKRFSVGKTVACHPEREMFLLIVEQDGRLLVRKVVTLQFLADLIRSVGAQGKDYQGIKNDVPDILWKPDDTLTDSVQECKRLSSDEVRQLVRLLKA
jgi:hypothetical protein